MIHFTVTTDDPERTLHIEDTDILVGWIEDGRQYVDGYGNPKCEWMFRPNHPTAPNGTISFSISTAYDEARAFAATLITRTVP